MGKRRASPKITWLVRGYFKPSNASVFFPLRPAAREGASVVFSRKSDLPCFCPVVFSASPSLISLPERAVDLPPSLICPLPEGLGARLWGLLAAALPSVHFLSRGGLAQGRARACLVREATQTFTSFPVELAWTLVSALGPACSLACCREVDGGVVVPPSGAVPTPSIFKVTLCKLRAGPWHM